MFSLIVAIIAIALLVAVVSVSMHYGGSSLTDAAARAEAARLQNEEQQLLGAVDVFQAQHGRWPQDIAELVSSGQLRTELQGPLALRPPGGPHFIAAAHAADVAAGWATPLAGQPVFTTGAVRPEVCRQYNLLARGDDGILRQPYSALRGQCWGEEGAYHLVVAKAGAAFGAAMAPAQAVDGAVPSTNAPGVWDVAPSGPSSSPGNGGGTGTGNGDGGDGSTSPTEPAPKVPRLEMAVRSTESFGLLKVGQSANSSSRSVNNAGTAPLTGLGLSAPRGFTVVQNSCGAILAVGQSCDFAVQFAPDQAVAYAGDVVVSSADGGSVQFRVNGQGGAAVLALSPNDAVSFGVVPVGARAAGAAHVVTNDGNVVLTGLSLQAPSGFAVVGNQCGSELAPGSSCSFGLEFAPAANAPYAGAVTVNSADAGMASFAVSGQGGSAQLGLSSTAPVNYGIVEVGTRSAAAARTVTNNGNIALAGLAIQPPTGFQLATSNCASDLPAGASCSFTLEFAPTLSKTYSGPVGLVSANAGSAGFAVSGQGGSAHLAVSTTAAANFGTVAMGTRSVGPARTLSNTGNVAVAGLALQAPAGFAVVNSDCGSNLAANASCSFAVEFAPTANKAYTGAVDVTSTNAGATNFAVSGQGGSAQLGVSSTAGVSFGTVALGTRSVGPTRTVSNAGNISLTGLALQAPAGFAIVNSDCGATLAAGASCSFALEFAPTQAKAYAGQVSIASVDGGSASFAVSGQGGTAQLALSSVAPLNFGVVETGMRYASATRTITNNGNIALNGLAVLVPTAYQVVSSTCGSTLPAGASCTFAVEFAPAAEAAYVGVVAVNSSNGGSTSFNVSGQGASAKVAVAALDFGEQEANSALSRPVTVSNPGLVPVNVTAPTAESVTGAGFSFGGTNCGGQLAPGASCLVQITYAPTGADVASGQVELNTGAGQRVAALSGQSVGAVLSFNVPSLSYFANYKTENSSGQVTVRNTGNRVASVGYGVTPFGNATSSTFRVNAQGMCVIEPRPDNSYPVLIRLEPGTSCTFTANYQGYTGVSDTSQALLSRLSLTADAKVLASVDLIGRVSVLQASVASLSWGGAAVQGVANVKTFELKNVGSGPTSQAVTATAMPGLGAGFAVDVTACYAGLAPGASCTVRVTYTRPPLARTTQIGVSASAGSTSRVRRLPW